MDIFVVRRQFVDVRPDAEVNEYLSLAGIDAPFQHAHGMDGTDVKPIGVGDVVLDGLFIICLLRQDAELVF